MTQPREDDADSQQESKDTSEPQALERGSTSPGPEQAGDETTTVGKVDDTADDEAAGSPAPQDQDSSSADDAPEDDAGADTEGVADAAASESPALPGPTPPRRSVGAAPAAPGATAVRWGGRSLAASAS